MNKEKGFTLIEILVATAILVIFIVGALGLYMRSHRISVDQQQLAQLQHDVRSAMFIVSRDIRSAGVGLPREYSGYFVEGIDGYGPGPINSDAIKIWGNFDEPLQLVISDYSGGEGGGSATVFLVDGSLQNQPYNCPEYYEDKIYFIFSVQCPGCVAVRYIPENQVHGCQGGEEHLVMPPGQSQLNPPGGLVNGNCDPSCWRGAIITSAQVKQFWLDTTGDPNDYPDLNLVPGQNGYIGGQDGINVLYMTEINLNDQNGSMIHYPLARNFENLQFQYRRDEDNDGTLEDDEQFVDWDSIWTNDPTQTSLIRQVRIWILGKTERPFTGVSGTPPQGMPLLYQRPPIANSPGSQTVDRHRRFLLETTVNIRNLSLEIYNQI